MTAQTDLQREISATLLRICAHSAFFATLALHAPIKVSQEVPTAATDGKSIFVNPTFWGSLKPGERDGLLLHEVLHAALLHVPRRAGRDPKLWNYAADIVINGMILREGFALPEGGLRDVEREHLSTEEVYDLLAREAEVPETQTIEIDLLDKTPADGEARPGDGGDGDSSDPGEAARQAEAARQWKNAVEQARVIARSSASGRIPARIEREFDAITGSRLDWRAHLWRYLTQMPTDFGGYDRRFIGRGQYLDTLEGDSLNVLVCVDTSGSIDTSALTAFTSELQGILRAYPQTRCELYYADAEVYGPWALRPGVAPPPPIGGGGTDFVPFFDTVARHPFTHGRTVAVYLTDGFGSFPDPAPRIPTLWVVLPGGRALNDFPFGETVRLLQ
ncbi:MAG: hypothetical protein K1X39_05645 [Thermoflexales bacterium]|nr:hypothetical protein [Thermoflexales bacterium]